MQNRQTSNTKRHFCKWMAQLATAFAVLLTLTGCINKHEHLICIYNTQSGFWRTQMSQEMIMEAAKHPELRLEFRTKQEGDGTSDEMDAMEYFISQKPDAIIFVSDNLYLRNHIRQAQNQGIPIVLLNNSDAKVDYTARIRNNNIKAGRDAALHLVKQLNGKGRVLEIKGVSASSDDRTKGFHSVMDSLPDIELVATLQGGYSKPDAYEGVKHYLDSVGFDQPIDAIFAQNDRMAIGAHEAFDEFPQTEAWNTYYIGVDGLMCDSIGVDRLEDGTINATMLLPTGGSEAIQQALRIIDGFPYERDIMLDAVIINRDTVPALRDDWNKRLAEYRKATSVQQETASRQKYYSQLEILLRNGLILVLILLVLLVRQFLRARALKKKVLALEEKNGEVAHAYEALQQKVAILEAEQKLLVEQRDRWFDLRSAPREEAEDAEPEPATFRNRLLALIRSHMEDEDFNVESLSDKMGLSRVQLNRKVKAEFDMNPGDLLRSTRMEHAMHLLRTTDFTISEVAYRVGYSNGKYFTRSFKEHFHCTPTDIRKREE